MLTQLNVHEKKNIYVLDSCAFGFWPFAKYSYILKESLGVKRPQQYIGFS